MSARPSPTRHGVGKAPRSRLCASVAHQSRLGNVGRENAAFCCSISPVFEHRPSPPHNWSGARYLWTMRGPSTCTTDSCIFDIPLKRTNVARWASNNEIDCAQVLHAFWVLLLKSSQPLTLMPFCSPACLQFCFPSRQLATSRETARESD